MGSDSGLGFDFGARVTLTKDINAQAYGITKAHFTTNSEIECSGLV